MSQGRRLPLLVVDGYNVVWGTERYRSLVEGEAHALPDVAHLSRDPYGHDPFERAREALAADVAAYAKGTHEAVVVFDGANNLNPERPDVRVAGVRCVFSATGESADSAIERMVSDARRQGRGVVLVTSDNTIRATVGGRPVATVSSSLLASNMDEMDRDVEVARQERTHQRLTLEDRLSPADREKLRRLLAR